MFTNPFAAVFLLFLLKTTFIGTLCYCDTFCNRTSNSDCCPDYFPHCEGLQRGEEGGPPSTPGQLALKPTLPPKREEDDEDLQYVEGAPEETVFFPPEEETDEECPQGRVSKDGGRRMGIVDVVVVADAAPPPPCCCCYSCRR